MIAETLILCWGNPGRQDDGLGPEFAARLEERGLAGTRVESGYLLQIEDADLVARYPRVLFVDADRSGPGPCSLRRLEPATAGLSFSSHSVTPGALLALTRDLFHAEPEAWVLGIRGYEFDDFEERLSDGARINLEAALELVQTALASGRFEETPPIDREAA